MTSDSTDNMAKRWREFQESLLRSEEYMARAEFGPRVTKWLKESAIFRVEWNGDEIIPLFQFSPEGATIPAMQSALLCLRPIASDWEIFAWFCQSDSWSCQGQKPKDLLLSNPAAVVEAAKHMAADDWF